MIDAISHATDGEPCVYSSIFLQLHGSQSRGPHYIHGMLGREADNFLAGSRGNGMATFHSDRNFLL